MPHPKDTELIPIGATVPWTKPRTKQKIIAKIADHCFQFQGRNFLNYEVEIAGIKGRFAAYHSDLEPISNKREPTT